MTQNRAQNPSFLLFRIWCTCHSHDLIHSGCFAFMNHGWFIGLDKFSCKANVYQWLRCFFYKAKGCHLKYLTESDMLSRQDRTLSGNNTSFLSMYSNSVCSGFVFAAEVSTVFTQIFFPPCEMFLHHMATFGSSPSLHQALVHRAALLSFSTRPSTSEIAV